MNDDKKMSPDKRRTSGRFYLVVGIMLALSGVAIYALQLQVRVLITPWYAPILATTGLLFVVTSLMQSRSIWRYTAAGLLALFAAGQWAMLFGPMSAPAYTGSAQAGRPFPAFTTTLANGSTFTQENFKGNLDTVMLFFRGRW